MNNIEEFMNKHINRFSDEELEKSLQKTYKESEHNPENMSYWLPKITLSETRTQSVLKIPDTEIVQLDYDNWKWLRSDRYTDDKIAKFDQYLKEQTQQFRNNRNIFLKTGIFSNKFYFKNNQANSKSNIGEKVLDIYYASLLNGADFTSEVVFREMIESKEDRPKIYSGMPLHTEFRVFYDYDTKKVVGISNYWHPELMEKNLNEIDKEEYLKAKEELLQDYENNKKNVAKEVEVFMEGCEGLSGKWSVDVMKNKDEFWLIDMARIELSALQEYMEEL